MNIQEILKQENRHHWKFPPNRDEVLDHIYSFINALADNDYKLAREKVLLPPMLLFRKKLDEWMKKFALEHLDDESLEKLSDDLSEELTYPSLLEEEYLNPVFSGKSFVLDINEEVSLRVPLAGYPTPVKLHFVLKKPDEDYFLRFVKISHESFL